MRSTRASSPREGEHPNEQKLGRDAPLRLECAHAPPPPLVPTRCPARTPPPRPTSLEPGRRLAPVRKPGGAHLGAGRSVTRGGLRAGGLSARRGQPPRA